METSPAHKLDNILYDSQTILKSNFTNYTHFITLSFLFLPLSIYLINTPRLLGQLFTVDHFDIHSIILHVLYILIVYLLSLCAIATITYTTYYHAYSGKPVNLSTAIYSLASSFFPVVTTAVIAHSLIILIALSLLVFVATNLTLACNYFGFVVDYNTTHFMWLLFIIGGMLIVIVTYFHVKWSLALVVVVVESKSGFEALTRSSYLVKGMGTVSLLLSLYFGCFFGLSVWTLSGGVRVLIHWPYVLFVMTLGSGLLMSFMRHYTAATVVLYNYCKDFHGELAVDVKIPHVDEAS